VRLGYTLTSPDLARNLQKLLLPFSVSALQIATGLTVLEHPEYVAARAAEAKRERAFLLAELQKLPNLTVYPSQTNFLLFRVGDAEAFFFSLLSDGVLVRRQDHLPGLEGCPARLGRDAGGKPPLRGGGAAGERGGRGLWLGTATVERVTNETQIKVTLELDAPGRRRRGDRARVFGPHARAAGPPRHVLHFR
jgi:hypothetical protein